VRVKENEVVGMFLSSSPWLTTDAVGLFFRSESFSTYLKQRILAKAGHFTEEREKQKE